MADAGVMQRCEALEIMDQTNLPDAALAQVYRELRMVHFWLGNTEAVLRILRNAIRERANGEPVLRVLDIGCGQGALMLAIREKLGLDVVGFDLRPAPAETPVPILTGNAVTDPLPQADIAVCLMLAHHLSETELVAMIGNVARSCRRFILLDLVRHPLPLMLFRVFVTPLLGRINALDGQTSIRRAYTAAEMRRIVDKALERSEKPVLRVRHTIGPLWIRQIVDISWETQ
jgi:2-polyprenyl-3-methyl-5-hydroxy-6-metoxy-1,4-benzoquinol methylase